VRQTEELRVHEETDAPSLRARPLHLTHTFDTTALSMPMVHYNNCNLNKMVNNKFPMQANPCRNG